MMTKKEKAAMEERRIFMEELDERVLRIEEQQERIKWEDTLKRKGWTGQSTCSWRPPKNIAKVYNFECGYSFETAIKIHVSVLRWNRQY